MQVRKMMFLLSAVFFLVSQTEAHTQESSDLDSTIHNLNRDVERMERYERAQRDLLSSNRAKVARWEELNKMMQKTKPYTAERATLQYQANELEASINNLKPSLEDYEQKIKDTQSNLRPRFRKLFEKYPKIPQSAFEKMSPSTRQLVAHGRSPINPHGILKDVFFYTRSFRLSEKLKFPKQIDKTPRSFSFEDKGKIERTRLAPGEQYDLITKAGDVFVGEFLGYENDRMIFKGAGIFEGYSEKDAIALKPQDISSIRGKLHDIGEDDLSETKISVNTPNRSSMRTDQDIKKAILRKGGIRGVSVPEASSQAQTKPQPIPSTPEPFEPLLGGEGISDRTPTRPTLGGPPAIY